MADKKKTKLNIKSLFRFADSGTRIDVPTLIITITLLCFGLIMLYSASYVVGIYRFKGDSLHYIRDQAFFAVVGVCVMFFAAKLDYHILKNYAMALMMLTYAMLVIVLFMPSIKGVNRWIIISGVGSFQPSEVAKFAVILLFATMISKNYDKMKTFQYGILPFIVVLATVVALLYFEPHLSGIVIICAIGAIMMFVGGSDIKWFVMGFALISVAVVAAVILYPESVVYAESRITAWQHPENDLQGAGYQSYQSLNRRSSRQKTEHRVCRCRRYRNEYFLLAHRTMYNGSCHRPIRSCMCIRTRSYRILQYVSISYQPSRIYRRNR